VDGLPARTLCHRTRSPGRLPWPPLGWLLSPLGCVRKVTAHRPSGFPSPAGRGFGSFPSQASVPVSSQCPREKVRGRLEECRACGNGACTCALLERRGRTDNVCAGGGGMTGEAMTRRRFLALAAVGTASAGALVGRALAASAPEKGVAASRLHELRRVPRRTEIDFGPLARRSRTSSTRSPRARTSTTAIRGSRSTAASSARSSSRSAHRTSHTTATTRSSSTTCSPVIHPR